MHTSLHPGGCADGSGNWLPWYHPDGSFEAVCPSDPRFAELERAHHAGQNLPGGPYVALSQTTEERGRAGLLGIVALLGVMGVLYWWAGRQPA